jgi:hypothetical protein
MYLRLDTKFYGDECYAAIILQNRQTYFMSRIGPKKFDILNVELADVEELLADVQNLHGKRERGGNPNHDCTGLPFRFNAAVERHDNEDGTVDLTVTESDWQYDI